MRCSRANQEDSELEAEKRRTFKGSAWVNLDVLHFSSNEHRDLDTKHVEYLKGCFERDRCRRLEVQNHIEAVIDQASLDIALRDSNVSTRELLTNEPNGCPKLIFPKGFKLRCLHGQHRIKAAQDFLLPYDKWWTVDFYTSDLNDSLEQQLHEHHSNDEKPSDGEAYFKIRRYHFQGDVESESKWKACLRGCRLKNLKGLLNDEDLTAGFDSLLDIPGVWYGMRLTTLQKMMPMGCKDEVLHYLSSIKKGLLALVGGDKQALRRLDQPTVKALELRAPGASTIDAEFLRKRIRGGVIFTAFTDHERDQILDRLPMVDGLILTLSSFFKDLNYLRLIIDCLGRLVDVPKQKGVYETIQRAYTGVNQQEGQVKIQVTEETFMYKSGTDAAQVDLGCRSLIAFAMRHYPFMPRDPVKEDAVRKATTKADQAILRRLADLAYQQGFKTTQITTLRQYSISQIAPDNDPPLPPLHVTSGRGIDMRQRSGIPRSRVYEADRYSLFINHLHDARAHQGEGITSFFVRKHVYLAFFGRPNELVADDTMTVNSPSNSRPRSNSPHSFRGASPSQRQRHPASQSRGIPESLDEDEDINDILSSYKHREDTNEPQETSDLSQERPEQENLEERLEQERQRRLEQERLNRERLERMEEGRRNQERLELRRIKERLEREDLQERLAQGLQAQKNSELEKQREQEQKRREQERQEEERRRQETRQQKRQEDEARVQGRTLEDSERRKRRNTQLDMESVDIVRQGNTSSNLQSGRELVLANQSSDSTRYLRTPVADQSSGRQERLEQEKERSRLEGERSEGERLEGERLEGERLEEEISEGERSERERSERERSEEERLEGERLKGERSEGKRSERERSEREGSEVEILEGERSGGERSEGETSEGKRSQGETSEGERPEGEGSEGRNWRRIDRRGKYRRRRDPRGSDLRGRDREQKRREEEARVQGSTLEDSERRGRRHTQLDMESVDIVRQGNTGSNLQPGGELILVNQSSGSTQQVRTPVADQSSGRQETLEQEKERSRLEQEISEGERSEGERSEGERSEGERSEGGRSEEERLERLGRARVEEERERSRLQRVRQERIRQERLLREKLQESFARELREQERLDREEREEEQREREKKDSIRKKERQRQQRREQEWQREERRENVRREQEKTVETEEDLAAQSNPARPVRGQQVKPHSPVLISAISLLQDPIPLAQMPESLWITFKVRERGAWRTAQSLQVYSSDPSVVERVAVKYMRKKEQMRLYDTDLNILTPKMCFQAAIANRGNMLLVIPETEIDISEELEASVSQMLCESGLRGV